VIVWGVELTDNVSAPANAAATAMGTAADRANVLQKALNGAQAAATKAAAVGDVAAFKKAAVNAQLFTEQLDKVRSSIPPVVEETHRLHDGIEHVAGAWEVFGGMLAARAVERAFEAIVDAGRELISMAIEAGERVEQLTAAFGALSGGGPEMGGQVFKMTERLAKELPQSEAIVQSWAQKLMGAGVTDMTKLHDSLVAVASATALMGKESGAGERVLGIMAKLNEAAEKGTKMKFTMGQLAGTGLTEEDLLGQLGMSAKTFELARKGGQITGTQIADAMTAALKAKGQGPLDAMMGEVSTQLTKGKDLFEKLFVGIDAKPLAEALKSIVGLLDQATPSGQLMHDVFVTAFGGILKAVNLLIDGFLHLIIWGLEIAIFVKKHATLFEALAAVVGGVMVGALAAMVVAAIPAIAAAWALAAGVIAATWPFLAIGAAIGLVAFGIYQLVKHWPEVKKFFTDLGQGAVAAGKAVIEGLANGIRAGADFVINAVKNLGGIVIKAIRAILGVHSPSTIMFGVGVNVAEGLEAGIDQGAPKAAEASARMGAGVAGAASAGSGSGSSSSSNVFNIDVHIEAGHAATPQQLQHIVEEEFGSLANRLAAMIGSAPVPA
jgi:hypothetical protein